MVGTTIQASFQTRTASGGYLKNAIVLFLPLLIFVMPTFNTVVRLQRELATGQYQLVLNLLTRHRDRVWPRGVLHLSVPFLTLLLLVLGTIKIVGANHMLDALTPGPYANVFTVASYVSTAVWFAIAIASLIWYRSNLNELKRESHALALFDQHNSWSPTE